MPKVTESDSVGEAPESFSEWIPDWDEEEELQREEGRYAHEMWEAGYRPTPFIATDSEWDARRAGRGEDGWLSTVFVYFSLVVVYFRDDLPGEVRTRLEAEAGRLGCEVRFVSRADDTNLLETARLELNVNLGQAEMLTYFSPKDVEYAVGWKLFKKAIEGGKVRQRRRLSGSVAGARLHDLFGWSNCSLSAFARTLGANMTNKTSLDDLKGNMARALYERPEEYLRYAVEDAVVLLELRERFVNLVNEVRRDCLGQDFPLPTENVPRTLGALVASLLEEWVESRAGDRVEDFRLACRKLGYLDPDAEGHVEQREAWQECFSSQCPDLIATFKVLNARYAVTALNAAGVRWWATRPPATDSACHLALVQGGRCNNELPFSCATGPGADIDVVGCYGEALGEMTFPVGVPSVWSFTSVDSQPTLGHWLALHEHDLVDGLWVAAVHGRLPFSQDLLYSKLCKPGNIARAVETEGREDRNIPADFAMLRREVVNAIITADVLKTLRAVCTNSEWAALKELKVTAAAAYRARDRVEDVPTWIDTVLGNRKLAQPVTIPDSPKDRRPRTWVGLNLGGFVGKLVRRPKEAKRLAQDESLPPQERERYSGLGGVLKLLVNTTYGVLASRFFNVGNTVVANNITARARVGVWMVAKALGLRQTITDGGIYTPGAVPTFSGKRPGLDVLSRAWEWRDAKRTRTYKPLPGCEGDLPDLPTLDRLAEEQVREFWTPYGLTLPFRLEHKCKFLRAAYWSKADNALLLEDGKREYKLRGKERNRRDDRKLHPTYDFLDAILDGKDDFPADLTYTKGGILKVGRYLQALNSNGYENLKGLRPGDSLPDEVHTARYSDNHMPVDDEAGYRRRKNRKKAHRGKPVPWFERYGPQGIAEFLRKVGNGGLA
jgi:hypothetical protein